MSVSTSFLWAQRGRQNAAAGCSAWWRKGVDSKNPGFFSQCTKDAKVDPAEVSKKGGILLANPLQSSKRTFSWGSFLSFFAFQEGMWDTQIVALLSSPTVSGRFVRQEMPFGLMAYSSQPP